MIKEICNTIFTPSWYEPKSITFLFVKQENEDYLKPIRTGM
jgi:hypothetical protein